MYMTRGASYGSIGEHQKAIEDFTRAIELNSENLPKQLMAQIYYMRGLSYKDSDDVQKATEDYQKAIELDPEVANTRQDYTKEEIEEKTGAGDDGRLPSCSTCQRTDSSDSLRKIANKDDFGGDEEKKTSDGRKGKTSVTGQTKRKKVGRNAPCPCGSGKKYKKCCGA